MKIEVELKSVYGNETIYPRCDMASQFSRIARTTTLPRRVLESILVLGYSIDVYWRGVKIDTITVANVSTSLAKVA